MKNKILTIMIASSFFLSGCTKAANDQNAAVTDKISSGPVKLEEFYENKNFEGIEFLGVNDVKVVDATAYVTGAKSNDDKTVCNIIPQKNTNDTSLRTVETDYQDNYPMDACVVNNKLYSLDIDGGLHSTDLSSNENHYFNTHNNLTGTLEHDDKYLIMLNEDGYILRYDFDFNFVDKINLSEIIGFKKEKLSARYILKTTDGYFIWANLISQTDEYGSLILFALNNDFSLKFKEEYPDIQGYNRGLFETEGQIMLAAIGGDITIGESIIFIDIVDPDTGSVLNRYEIEDCDFAFPGENSNEFIIQKNAKTYTYNAESRQLKELTDFNSGRLAFSDNCYFSFSNPDKEILTGYTKFNASENSAFLLDQNYSSSMISNSGQLYTVSVNDTGNIILNLYSKNTPEEIEKSVELVLSTPVESFDSTLVRYTENEIYTLVIDESTLEEFVAAFSDDGKEIYRVPSQNISDIFCSNGSVYITCIDYTGCTLYELKDKQLNRTELPSGIITERIYPGDEDYPFYICSSFKMYGYDPASNSLTRILNCADSLISSVPDFFVKYSDSEYICYSDELTCLKKADDETLKQLNSRKIITVAGTHYSLSPEILSRIKEFNSDRKDCFITYKDYSEDFLADNPLNTSLMNDVIKGNIPDVFLLDGMNNYNALKQAGAFADISQYIDSSSQYSDFYKSVIHSYSDQEKQYCLASTYNYNAILCDKETFDKFNSNITYKGFLDTVIKNNIGFTDPAEAVYRYFIIDHANGFIDYSKRTCNFTSDEFILLLKYIKDSSYSGGELTLCTFPSLSEFERLYANENAPVLFDVSPDGTRKGILKAGNTAAFSAASESVSESVDFYSEFLKQDDLNPQTDSLPTDLSRISPETCSLTKSECESVTDNLLHSESVTAPDQTIINILSEAMVSLLEEEQPAETIAETIQNKIQLYLKEIG